LILVWLYGNYEKELGIAPSLSIAQKRWPKGAVQECGGAFAKRWDQ
jgi:hypothetical protein